MSSSTAVLGSVFLATGVFLTALQDGNSGQGRTPVPGSTSPKIIEAGQASRDRGLLLQRGERLVGTDLFDTTGARLGKIDDMVFDAKGNVSHVILQGEVGGQPRLMPIPWSALTFPASFQPGMESPTDKVTTSISSTRLQLAPHFPAGEWPKDGQDTVFTESDNFFRSGAAGEGGIVPEAPRTVSPPAGARFRASRMRNLSVMDDSGETLGSLGQFVIDSNSGRIAYATMIVPGEASPRAIAVPWETFTASRQNDKDHLRLAVPKDRLQTAPEFQAGTQGWKQMSDPSWVSNMYSYYSARPYWSSTPSSKPATPLDKGNPTQPSRP